MAQRHKVGSQELSSFLCKFSKRTEATQRAYSNALKNFRIWLEKSVNDPPDLLAVTETGITTALAQPGAQLHVAQDWAGHRSPNTTRRYDREANSARRAPGHALAPLFMAAKESADRAKRLGREEEDAVMLNLTLHSPEENE